MAANRSIQRTLLHLMIFCVVAIGADGFADATCKDLNDLREVIDRLDVPTETDTMALYAVHEIYLRLAGPLGGCGNDSEAADRISRSTSRAPQLAPRVLAQLCRDRPSVCGVENVVGRPDGGFNTVRIGPTGASASMPPDFIMARISANLVEQAPSLTGPHNELILEAAREHWAQTAHLVDRPVFQRYGEQENPHLTIVSPTAIREQFWSGLDQSVRAVAERGNLPSADVNRLAGVGELVARDLQSNEYLPVLPTVKITDSIDMTRALYNFSGNAQMLGDAEAGPY
ncbi:hypothetical protein [Maricaulis salignorans]|uniref:hypothetical protein n=1 Tax=Maricaulis salignorans TaxID=144026 RepID=UPI003A8EDE68